jgi:hypothetical protein
LGKFTVVLVGEAHDRVMLVTQEWLDPSSFLSKAVILWERHHRHRGCSVPRKTLEESYVCDACDLSKGYPLFIFDQ